MLDPALGQVSWHSWSEVHWFVHIPLPPLLVVAGLAVPVLPPVPKPEDELVTSEVPVDGVPAELVGPTAVVPPAPPIPVPSVSAPDAQDARDARPAGVNRAKTTKVTLACFTGL